MTVDTKLIWICLCRFLRKVIVQATLIQNLTLLKFTRIAISRRNQDLVTDGDHVTTFCATVFSVFNFRLIWIIIMLSMSLILQS